MAKILWIASYPKSGNTWIRFLIASLFSGSIERSIEVEHLIPDIHVGINDTHLRDDRKTFVKTHWMHHPRLPLREDTIGAIYIM